MVAPHELSPNIGNYYVGRGICYIKKVAPTQNPDADFVDCGNVTEFTFEMKPTRLEHYSSRVGVRTKDMVVVTELAATLTVIMEEFTARNMGFALLGTVAESPPGTYVIDGLADPLQYAAFKFVSTNIVGPQWTITFPNVIFSPNKAISLIPTGSGSWGQLSFDADAVSTDIQSP